MDILLVEDNEQIRDVVTILLRSHGYNVAAFADAEGALTEIATIRPQVAILDWMLPGLDGLSLCKQIKSMPEARNCGIIVLTARDRSSDLEAVLANGADDYVSKPFDPGLLLVRVKVAAHLAQTRAQMAETLCSLSHSEDRYSHLINLSPHGVFVEEREKFTYVNSTFVEMLGATSAESLLGKFVWDVFHPEFTRQILPRIKELKVGERLKAVETQVVQQGGRAIAVEINASCITHESKRVTQVIVQDIEDRKRVELQLRQSQKMDAIGRLAGGIAHDFNNLLTVIVGRLDLLMARPDVAHIFSDLNLIRETSERAADPTKQLLQFSRMQVIQSRVLNLNALITENQPLLRRLIPESITILLDLNPAIDPILADPTQIMQVLMNLCINARDAMPGGGRLRISTSPFVADSPYADLHLNTPTGRYVQLSVTDTGHGMDEETRQRLFEPFFTTKEVGKGTGLGLSTVYGIVKRNNGHIWVYSEPGKGTTFKVYLPVATQNSAPIPAPKSGSALAAVSIDKSNVLVVEDEPGIRDLIIHVLEQGGFNVTAACDGEEALEKASGQRFDILITDVVMPKIGGVELAKTLLSRHPDMTLILMSGYAPEPVDLGPIDRTKVHYLEKPFTPKMLTLLTRVVGKKV